ncbi:MAG TPA: NUDIX domain-containing protein, partial [Nitriliruptoraceae bacterium]|nr:NUDIX domain-containing protein [Nitriliruptoraceae bacterium]
MHHSHGLLLWRERAGAIEVLLGHMGGPYWARRDAGAWTIPKGLAESGDTNPTATAEREFREELGQPAPPSDPTHPDLDLGSHRASGKEIHVIARRGDLDPGAATGGTFTMEWPPKSGRAQEFPEVDRAAWMGTADARVALAGNQRVFLDRLLDAITD